LGQSKIRSGFLFLPKDLGKTITIILNMKMKKGGFILMGRLNGMLDGVMRRYGKIYGVWNIQRSSE
jgi:hypothetical protein